MAKSKTAKSTPGGKKKASSHGRGRSGKKAVVKKVKTGKTAAKKVAKKTGRKKVAKTVGSAGSEKKKAVKKATAKKPAAPPADPGKGVETAESTKKVKAQERTMTSDKPADTGSSAVLDELLPSGKEPGPKSAEKHGKKDKKEKKRKDKKRKDKKARVKFKSVMLREEAISYFEAIVAGLKRGSIQVRQGEEAIELKPTPQLDVSVKASSRDQDESIEFELKWRTASGSDLTISTD